MPKKVTLLAIIILVTMGLFLFAEWNRGSAFPNPVQSPAGNQTTSSVAVTNPTSSVGQQAPTIFEYHIALPNTLMLVDSQGRRTGKDPATGALYHEIPDTSYTEEGIGSTNTDGVLFAWNVTGRYTLYVLGGTTGPYRIVASPRQELTGIIQRGAMDAYSLNSLSVTDKPNLSFQSTLSSTASVTTAPPNNLPPSPTP